MKVSYRVEIEQEEDGRFLAEVVDLPGVMAYGGSADEVLAHAQALALRVLEPDPDGAREEEWDRTPIPSPAPGTTRRG